MKLLAVDIGNTNIVLSLMNESGEIEDTFRFVTKVERSCEEFESILREFIGEIEIEDAIVSCVVPEVLVPFKEAIYKYLNKEVMLIDHTLDSGILIKTDRAEEVGADLIADAAAGYALYGGNILVADFGTATTFQYIDEEGAFLYCVILPGIEISAKTLSSMASLLPDIELQVPNTILATNTIDCMRSGVMYGYIGSVEYIIKRFMSELKRDDIRVIATGGLGRLISQESTLIDVYDGDLMFKGMKIIYDRNK